MCGFETVNPESPNGRAIAPVRPWPDPFTLAHGDVVLVDSIAAWPICASSPG